MENFSSADVISVLLRILVFVGMLVLLAYANEGLFQKLLAEPVIDPIAAALLGSERKQWATVLKKAQPFMVFGAAILVSIGLQKPLTEILTGVVPAQLTADPTISVLMNAVGMAVGAYKVHDIEEAKLLNKQMQKASLDLTTRTAIPGG